jgi:2-iminobutanoate/2-iminopropanoate deaminase
MMATDVKGDITAQTKQVFDNLRGTLQRAGSSVDSIAAATVTLQQASDLGAMDQVFRAQFKGDPPARTTLLGNMVRPGALLEIAVIAIPNGGPRKAIRPSGWMKPASPYSYAVQSGDTLFLSGMVPSNNNDLSVVSGDLATQTKKAMENAVEVLKTAGMSLEDTVNARVSLRRAAQAEEANKIYSSYWNVPDPLSSGVVSGPPARGAGGQVTPGPFDVQITFIAVKGSSPREIVVPPNADGSPGRRSGTVSPAIKVGNRIWVAGGVGTTPENAANVKAQTTELLTRLGRNLKAGGFDFTDVVATEIWVKDVSQSDDMNEAYRAFFPNSPPVRKMVGAEPLNGALVTGSLMAVK